MHSWRIGAVASISVAALAMASCSKAPESTPAPSTGSTDARDETKPIASTNPERNAYFGDLHLHTGYSADAALMTDSTPDDAYRYAKGEAIARFGNQMIQLKRPLDFLAVTDHAEYAGAVQELRREGGPLYDTELGKAFRSDDYDTRMKAYLSIVSDIANNKPRPELVQPKLVESVWAQYSDEAKKHYQPGKFTTFIAFEWTSMPDNNNLHRNVIFGSEKVPAMPFSALDSQKPEDLWTYLEKARNDGSDVVAISHNGNISGGLMFAESDSYGKPLDAAYARRRTLNEVAHEIIQVKGASETHPLVAPNDEFAGFEASTFQLGTFDDLSKQAKFDPKHSYLREAYKNGLLYQQKIGANPFKFGIVAGSDSHAGGSQPEEDNFKGVHGDADDSPEARIVKPKEPYSYAVGSGGLTGVWAEQNTRESIFAAIKRNETFGTSGVRVRPRFFGGFGYSDDLVRQPDWVKAAYSDGVPMGGNLPKAPTGKAPTFAVAATKDPEGANLDRIQIVKGWVEDGKAQDKIYNVALSGDRKVDPKTGKAPAVGNTVDIKSATYTNDIGAAELSAVWTDPDFDSTQPAFYYVRVLEIPTPRWSTYDAAKLGIAPRKDVEATIQERAWTSPIWYTP